MAAISAAILAAAYFLLNATVDDFEYRLLRGHADTVARHLTIQDGKWSLRLPPTLQGLYAQGLGGYAIAVVDSESRIIYSTLPEDDEFRRSFHGRRSEAAFFHQRHGAFAYYGVTLPVVRDGRTAWIQIGQNLQNPDVIVDDVVTRFLTRISWFALPIFIILLGMDVYLMRRMLAPIVAASHVASSIGPNRPLTRLPTAGLPREVLPLAEAVNDALERLDRGLTAQREFTADAAHELRTPLAILRTHVDTMLDNKTALALQGDIDTMSHIVDQLLELAELEGFSVGQGEELDLAQICAEVVAMMAPVALAENKTLELTADPAAVRILGDARMLSRAVRNLVENAIRHSRPETAIEVDVAAPALIRVKDRGPGIRPAERELVFRRFWRKNRQDRGHAGLGLAIVAKIVQIHAGRVSVRNRVNGGAEFTIELSEKIAEPNP